MKIIYDVKLNKTTKHARVRALEKITSGKDKGKYVEVGYIKLNANGKTIVDGQKVVKIDWIFVDPDQRGKGIATGMYQAAADFACGLGMVLASDEVLRTATKKFWEKQRKAGAAKKKVSSRGVGTLEHRYLLSCPARVANPPTNDETIRNLERLARQGDPDAERLLAAQHNRMIPGSPSEDINQWNHDPERNLWRWDTGNFTEAGGRNFEVRYLIDKMTTLQGGKRTVYEFLFTPDQRYHDARDNEEFWGGGDRFSSVKQATKRAREHYAFLFGNKKVKIVRDREWDQYQIKVLVDGKATNFFAKKLTYFTDDKQDAQDTAQAMQRRLDENAALRNFPSSGWYTGR